MIEIQKKTEKEIIFVTTNKGKIASAQKELENIKVLPIEAELIEPRSDDIREIAKQKVMQAYSIVKQPCIALDSGFFIPALNGFPRAYVNHMLDTIGIEGILKLMDGVENRACEFRSCLAYYDGEEMRLFESKSPGVIAEKIRGSDNENSWSDLWYIFIPRHFRKTMAEFDEEDFLEYTRVKEKSGMKKFGEWYSGL
ncbi:non-canonical purine NTP pyrophosphatase [Rossellomorea sp. YZS02]|uniref:non-canonical purine NTP pyrophosphatase n=1 Tax=Rossellomorea sp. YZS02 TaxID=3097358 RepID=UPI002A103CA8|nr:non-canonical purine NTP pyrophosphatase [Rossellomorea sp. YZS02]MDX8344615.1 non-canonical purine NTP pyrophosphatase [Rossellomorea sp. YZS02]